MTQHSRSARWWELPRARQRQGRQGRLALVKGREVGIECPKCQAFPVVYNGNYFCDNWNHPAGPDDCTWALAHPAVSQRDRQVCDLIGIDHL